MDLKYCMNAACGASSVSIGWCKGWVMQSGGFAVLCDKCGFVYEQSKFCDVFHCNDPGWRQCNFCGKYLHCGCIVSQYLYELHDTNGIRCAICARKARHHQPVVTQTLSILEKHDGSIGASRKENENQLLQNTSQRGNKVVRDYAENEGMNCWFKPGPNVPYIHQHDEFFPYIQQLGSSLVSQFHRRGSSSSSGSSLAQTNLSMTLGAAPLGNSSIPFHSAAVVDDKSEKILRGPKFRPIKPKIPLSTELEANNASFALRTNAAMTLPIIRADHQLLARYSPRITDQELQQLSKDSNSTVVPLFEKVLTASDVGPTGRIVLPKSCAEVYFPKISEPEGIPLEIHDVNRNIWKVQFKLWLNNSSTMYVLEGVRPFIQAMQLKPGDTATFNRMDPEGKPLIGVRRKEPLPPPPSQLPPPPPSAAQTPDESSQRKGLVLPPEAVPKKKRTRKNKRLSIGSKESILEVAHDMLTETPIFVNGSIFMARSNRVNEQWTQCDSCSKWRKIPSDIVLPPKWTCVDNIWDQKRSSCSAPNELTPMELENLVKMKNNQGMHILADTAILEDIAGNYTSKKKVSTITTKHTHQQQPSGRGKHRATCTCNECMKVKNQKRIQMMQDMNRQSERETGVLKFQFQQLIQ